METIEVPIGPNASLDGGPFFACEGQGPDHPDTNPEAGTLALEDQEGNGFTVTTAMIQENLREEMERDEPVSVSTGDVGTAPTTDDDVTVGIIRLPLVRGFHLRVHDLPGQGNDVETTLADLRGNPGRKRHFERKLARHGGRIGTIN